MSEQPSANSGEETSADAIAGRIGGLRMANSFASDSESASGSYGPPQSQTLLSQSRSESPPREEAETEQAAAKVSPPAGGTQSAVQQIHSTPIAGADDDAASSPMALDLSDVNLTSIMGPGPGLPFRTNRGAASATSASATTGGSAAANSSLGGRASRHPMLHELTPVIRNTSGSGEDLDLHQAVGGFGNIVSPEGKVGAAPMLEELSIPARSNEAKGGGMKHLPPRVSALPMRTHQSSKSSSKTSSSSSSTPSVPRPTAVSGPDASADQTLQQQQKPPPIPQGQRMASRSYSAGNLDSQSLVKTVREYYSAQNQQNQTRTQQEPRALADEFGQTNKAPPPPSGAAEHGKTGGSDADNRAQLAIERALASVGSSPAAALALDEANVHQAIQNAVQDVTGGTTAGAPGFDTSAGLFRIAQGPPPGPPIPLASPERRVQSFDRRNVPSRTQPPGSPRPSTGASIAPSSSASPGRSGLPPLPGSTGPASQYLQPEQSVFAAGDVEKPQYQPTRDTSLTEIGRVGDPGIESIFKEGRPAKMHSPKRPAPGSASQQQLQMQGIFQAQAAAVGQESPSLRNPIPLDQRDWSIPSIRMAHHVNAGESYTTLDTYDDDTLGEEDDIAGCGDDDATLSSRGSAQEARSSIDALGEIDVATGEEDEDLKPSADRGEPTIQPSNRFVIEQGMETVTHQVDDAIVGAADSVHAIAAPPGVFRTEGGHKKRHRKNRKSEEALDWLKSVEVGGVIEAASSKFLTGAAPSPAAAVSGAGMGPSVAGAAPGQVPPS